MEIITSFLLSKTNHELINMPNLFNFLINSFDHLMEDERPTFIDQLRLNMGNTFCDKFRIYVFAKLPKHALLDLL